MRPEARPGPTAESMAVVSNIREAFFIPDDSDTSIFLVNRSFLRTSEDISNFF